MITWISRDGVLLHEVWSSTSSREVLLHEVWSSRGSIVPYSYTSSPNHNRPRSQPSEPLVIRSTPSTHHTPLNGNQGVRLELFYCLEWSCAVVFCKNGVMWTRKMAAAKLPLCIFSAASFVILICIIDCLSLAFDHDGWTCMSQPTSSLGRARKSLMWSSCLFSKQPFWLLQHSRASAAIASLLPPKQSAAFIFWTIP